jgi:hypothetical protein
MMKSFLLILFVKSTLFRCFLFQANFINYQRGVDPLGYLTKYGYLDAKQLNLFKTLKSSRNYVMFSSNSSNSSSYSTKNSNVLLEGAIKKFQHFANINQTGRLDEKTLRMMKMPRCGNPDLKFVKKNRTKRYILQG